MAWRWDSPLFSMTDEQQNQRAKEIWEGESLGGITEDNNRLPRPVVWLLGLTIITAFLVTFPLWGQRPTAAIYAEYIGMMDTPEVQRITEDAMKMEYIVSNVKDSKWKALQDRHPVDMDDLRMIKDQVIELQRAKADLEEYTVVGNKVVLANFEGNKRADGSTERKQPWWDLGYTIDLFYVTYFCIAVMIAVKRLPNHTWQPDHTKHSH